MERIDLHVHSIFSDGTLTPEELVDLAIEKKLSAFALTDHDTVSGIPRVMRYANKQKQKGINITAIPGIELSTGYKNRDVHILGFYINEQNTEFKNILNSLKAERDERNVKMALKFQKAGFSISIDELKRSAENATITRAHFAKLLMNKGYVKTIKEAFDKYLNDNCPFYVSRNFISPQEAIRIILDAEGIPVLAHPILCHLPPKELDSLVNILTCNGLKGIETIYSTYSKEEEKQIRSLATKYNLIQTGGSDFHGTNKPGLELADGYGNLCIPATILEKLQMLKK